MRRRRAIVLGMVIASVVIYIIWWARQFYIRPDLLMDHQIPAEAEEVIREWHDRSGGFSPARLSWANILDSIRSPSGAAVNPAVAILESETEIRVIHDRREWNFIRRAGGWALDHARP